MNKVVCSLNFMYSMERFATAIYQIQKGRFKNKTVAEKLAYAVENEQQHALNLRKRIIMLDKTPTRFAFLFQVAGNILGYVSRCLSKSLALKTDIAIEKRAVRDYSYFLGALKLDDNTELLLKNIIADEEFVMPNEKYTTK